MGKIANNSTGRKFTILFKFLLKPAGRDLFIIDLKLDYDIHVLMSYNIYFKHHTLPYKN